MASYLLKHVKSSKAAHFGESGTLLIGRSRSCDIRLKTDSASRKHCLVRLTEDGPVARDLGSRNGTRVNGKKIDGDHLLKAGDEITVGSISFEVVTGDDPSASESADSLAASQSGAMFMSLLEELKALRGTATVNDGQELLPTEEDSRSSDALQETIAEGTQPEEETTVDEKAKKRRYVDDASSADAARDAIERHFRRR